ncbi:flagellar basal body P-ring formation chaperone FlgA [Marinovum algicola]|uniref:flagellar basal body P-ring formation chaperone FlgA n=1 Tax=Marinovum algicola TaxID=42444 RepID=UPI0024BB773C|nr:flagellar basal body P-ring formation chaperone FlgA [Marinovum algicola]
MRLLWAILLVCLAGAAWSETVVPARTLRANTVIAPADLALRSADVPGAFSDPAALIGQETRVTLYAGRPIRPGDIGPPALVTRNQIVTLHFTSGGLRILADGRALGRGGAGDRIRVMNLSSRTTLFGTVQPDGTINVSQ